MSIVEFVVDDFWHIEIKGFGLVRVSLETIHRLAEYRQLLDDQPESGGVLIGQHINSFGKIVINDFTPPQKTDNQSRFSYFRSRHHNKLVNKAWSDSDGHSTYVGLWHTHPEPNPTPSTTDFSDWRNTLNESIFAGERLFFFIVGQERMRCWVGKKTYIRNTFKQVGEFKFYD